MKKKHGFLQASQGPQHPQGRDTLRCQGGDGSARNAQAGANQGVLRGRFTEDEKLKKEMFQTTNQ